MRAPGIAAIVLGAVIALSGTLGVTYRSEAAALGDPVTASASDSSPASATPSDTPTTDATTPAASDSASRTDSTSPSDGVTPSDSPSPSDSATPTDSASPSDSPIPSDSGTPIGFAPIFNTFASLPPATNPSYTFTRPNSVDASFDLNSGASSGDIVYAPADPATGDNLSAGTTTCDVSVSSTHNDCRLSFGTPDHGLWHLTAEQVYGETATQDAYVYIPPAPTLSIVVGEGSAFTGTGIAGDTVDVFDSSGADVCPGNTVDSYGDWYCGVGSINPNNTFTATQYDVGDPTADGVTASISIIPGGISGPSDVAAVPKPAMTYNFFPGGIVISGVPTDGADTVITEVDGWTPNSEGGSFPTSFLCANAVIYSPSGAAPCTFTPSPGANPPEPLSGWYNPYSYQTGEGGQLGDYADDYFFIPAAPSITNATAARSGVVTVTGTGVAADGIRVIVDGSTVVCPSTTVAPDSTWSCATPALSKGTHTFQAYDVDLGAGQNPALVAADSAIVYQTGGISPLSPTVSAKVTGSTVTPTPTPTPTPTDFSNWFFSITGVDLNNVHPGDKFTVTGTGLPPGSTVSGELHSKAVSIGSAVVQPDGSFSLPVVVPADFPAGAHTIVMTLTPVGSVPAVSQQPLKVVPAAASDNSSPTPTPSDSPSPLGSDQGPGIDHKGPNSNILTHGLDSIADVIAHPAKVPAAIEIGLVLLIFAVLPGHLLNATLAEQYERFNARRPKRRRDAAPWWTRLASLLSRAPFLAGLALTTVTALLFGFADPRFGFSIASLRLFLGLAIALAIVSYLVNMVTGRIMRGRWKVDVEVNLRPLGLILTVVGVVVSRLLDFAPGFLIGLVLGLVISEKQLAKHAWRAVLLRTGLLLGLALLAWLAFSLFDAKQEGGTFASELAVETLVAITTEAIVGLLVELLPLKLLEGEKLYEKSKILWGALYLVAIFIFVVAVVPWEGNWAQLGSSLWTWIGIVVGFGILATSIYIFFRVRSHDEVEHHIDKDEDGDQLVPIGSDDDER